MRHTLTAFFLLLILSTSAQTKTMHKGYVIYNLGVDTTFIGYYEVKDNNFRFKIVGNTNALTVTTMSGTLYPNGELKEAKGYSYAPMLEGEGKRLTDYHAYVNNDSTYFIQVRDGKETVSKYSAKGMIANAIGTPFLFMLPVLTPYAPKNVNEQVSSYHLIFGQNRPFTMKRLAPDLIEMGSQVMGYFKIYVDNNGNLKSIDGIGSSWNVKGTYVPELDMDEYIRRFVVKAQQNPLKPLNQKDSIISRIDGVDVRVDYSRPQMRGRVIFGEVVPWNRVWRTGANEPTKLTINRSIYFDGKELPPGEYSLFTLPANDRWTLIINKQTDMWGTDHNPDYDFLRVPMQTTALDKPLELMTIDVSPTPNGGILSVMWEKTKAFVGFTTKK